MHNDSSSHRFLPAPRSDPTSDSTTRHRFFWRRAMGRVPRHSAALLCLLPTRALARAQRKATWSLTWLLLFIMVALRLLFDLPTIALVLLPQHRLILSLLFVLSLTAQSLSGFFLFVVLQYGLARSAQGDGSLLSHAYTIALVALPLLLLSSLMTLISTALSGPEGFLQALSTGGVILLGMLSNVLLLQTVQHLHRRTAISVVVVSWFLLLLLILAAHGASSFFVFPACITSHCSREGVVSL